jgi:hypothetical protein
MTAPSSRPAPAKKPLVTRRRVVSTALLLLALVLFVSAFRIHPEPTKEDRPPAVVAVSPGNGDTDVRQTTLFAELRAEFDGELSFDGQAIPKDQLDVIQTGNVRLSFTPGPGKAITSFAAGHRCATVSYFPRAEGAASITNYSWCFTLH